jgi:hypothetical protein
VSVTPTHDRAPDSPENPHAGFGPVVLDIGGDVGAVVVTTPMSMVGAEVDIVPADADLATYGDHGHGDDHGHGHGHGHGHRHRHRPHVAVVRRPLPDGREVATLVYPEVVAGRYRLLLQGTDDVVMEVSVAGGEVTQASWPV